MPFWRLYFDYILAALVCPLCFSSGAEPQEANPPAPLYSQKVRRLSLTVVGGHGGLIMSTLVPLLSSPLGFPGTGFLVVLIP